MIILFVLTYCLGQNIEKTLYLIEGELYKQSLPQLFSDTTDQQYSFVDSSKGFQIDQSNLKQLPLVGKYARDSKNIISQKQYKNLNDHQGNRQYGILQEYETGKFQICYNFDISKLDLDYCIQLDATQTGYDFVFLNFNSIAVSSILNNQFVVTIYEGQTKKTQLTFQPSLFDSSIKSTKIDQMIDSGDQYLLVVGIYSSEINVPIDVLKIVSNSTLVKTSYTINIKNIVQEQSLLNILDFKGSANGTVFLQVSNATDRIIYQIQLLQYSWKLQFRFNYQNNIGFEIGFYNLRGYSQLSLLSIQESNYRLQQLYSTSYFEKSYQQAISKTSKLKFTQNYLIVWDNNQLIINNFQNNIQKVNNLEAQILSIDVDFINDILIVFTTNDIRKYQLQDQYLTYQGLKTDELDTITVSNGVKIATIQFRILDKKDESLYQISSPQNIYYNEVYSYRPTKIPISVSGFNPVLKVSTHRQLQVESIKLKIWQVQQNPEVPLQSQLIMSNGYTSIFKQFKNYSFEVYPCYQYGNLQCTENKVVFIDKYREKVKLHTLQQGTDLGYLIQVGNVLDVYYRASSGYVKVYLYATLQENQNINDVVVADKIYVAYQSYVKVYTYPNGVLINKIDSQLTGINDPIKIWTNPLFNNYIFILSQTGQLVVGQYTNQFYLTQSIKLNTINVDISIIAKNKLVISQKINTNYDISLYEIIEGQIVKQYELDLHGYTVTDHILLKDYPNGKVGVSARLVFQKALLLYGITEFQRDQLQQVINIDQDIKQLSILSNNDETHILQSYNSKDQQTMIFVYYDYQYIQINTVTEYQIQKFSQLLTATYNYKNAINEVAIKKSLIYEYNYFDIVGQEIEDIKYTSKQNYIVKDLPLNLFSGQINQIYSSSSQYVKFETRIKNNQQIKSFGSYVRCYHVPKFERIICTNSLEITYHKYNGEIIQKLNQYPTASLLTINKDNLSGVLIQSQDISLLKITQISLTLYPNILRLNQSFSNIIFYKNWIVNYIDNRIFEYYLVKTDNGQFSLEKYKQIEMLMVNRFDYHPASQSIYFTQYYSGLLNSFKSSLEGDTLEIGTVIQYNIEGQLNINKVYVVDLKLDYLQIIDNNIMLSSSYGHIYTFSLEDIRLINLCITIGPSYSIFDIKIQDEYMIVKGTYLNLYKITGNWTVDTPYLSLESISIYNSDCIALYKQNGVVNILYSDKSSNVVNAIINEKITLQISNLQQNAPSELFIAALNSFSSDAIYFKTVKVEEQGTDIKSIIIYAFLGILVMLGIMKQ